MAILATEAFVLKRSPFRETSLLATLFSRTAGKMKILVKGVRRDKNALAAVLEPFSHISVVYYEKVKSDVHLASSVGIVDPYSTLRRQLDRMSYASYITELVDTLFGFGDPHDEVFHLLAHAYRLLERCSPPVVARVFEVKILEQVGWLPVLTRCVLCGSDAARQVFFSPRNGGIICALCDRGEPGSVPISQGTLRSLLFFKDHEIQEAVKLRIGRLTERELERIGERFLKYHLDYALRSPRFIAEVQPMFKR
ncbi:MAG: DNA repair protein RecO [Omnitrophica bacterium RIFCSPLOWO2_12_FULL_50_11]|nr:MAG: DNA repair protein RecO [Omnitrophica bacterium RIFCSPLOWO2_12_FULL_50_11]